VSHSPSKPIQRIRLVLPAYNESAAIEPLIGAATDILTLEIPDWAIIVVDDGSQDDTAARVARLAAANPRVRLVRHPRNRGLGPAILTGLHAALEHSGGEATREPDAPSGANELLVVCMDADMTHPSETISQMRQAADGGADLVIASRFRPGSRQVGVPLFRRLLSWGARQLFARYLGLPGVRDYTCGFRAFRGSLLEEGFAHFGPDGLITRSGFACTDELLVNLAELAPKIQEVPFVLHYDHKVGRSKMNLLLTIRETLKLLRAHRDRLRGRSGSR
jgi:dolichol-phosphate mannosyltransferase